MLHLYLNLLFTVLLFDLHSSTTRNIHILLNYAWFGFQNSNQSRVKSAHEIIVRVIPHKLKVVGYKHTYSFELIKDVPMRNYSRFKNRQHSTLKAIKEFSF